MPFAFTPGSRRAHTPEPILAEPVDYLRHNAEGFVRFFLRRCTRGGDASWTHHRRGMTWIAGTTFGSDSTPWNNGPSNCNSILAWLKGGCGGGGALHVVAWCWAS